MSEEIDDNVQAIIDALLAQMDRMSPEQRIDVLNGIYSKFCRHCGIDDPYCPCWNDE